MRDIFILFLNIILPVLVTCLYHNKFLVVMLILSIVGIVLVLGVEVVFQVVQLEIQD